MSEAAACQSPIPFEDLVAYERGELAGDAEARVEEHFFECAQCSAALSFIQAAGATIARLVAAGRLTVGVTAELLARLSASVSHRSYRLAPGGSVACTLAPEDAFAAVWLELETDDDEVVDLTTSHVELATGRRREQVAEGVPVDREAGAAICIQPGAWVRALPRSRLDLVARARGPRGERVVGHYVLDHTPWDELPHG